MDEPAKRRDRYNSINCFLYDYNSQQTVSIQDYTGQFPDAQKDIIEARLKNGKDKELETSKELSDFYLQKNLGLIDHKPVEDRMIKYFLTEQDKRYGSLAELISDTVNNKLTSKGKEKFNQFLKEGSFPSWIKRLRDEYGLKESAALFYLTNAKSTDEIVEQLKSNTEVITIGKQNRILKRVAKSLQIPFVDFSDIRMKAYLPTLGIFKYTLIDEDMRKSLEDAGADIRDKNPAKTVQYVIAQCQTRGQPYHVTIIDNDPDFAECLEDMIKTYNENIIVSRYHTPSEITDFLHSEDARIADLVFMDIKLDGSLDGIECSRKFKELHGRNTKIITVTGQDEPECVKAAFEAGSYFYLKKPFGPQEIYPFLQSSLVKLPKSIQPIYFSPKVGVTGSGKSLLIRNEIGNDIRLTLLDKFTTRKRRFGYDDVKSLNKPDFGIELQKRSNVGTWTNFGEDYFIDFGQVAEILRNGLCCTVPLGSFTPLIKLYQLIDKNNGNWNGVTRDMIRPDIFEPDKSAIELRIQNLIEGCERLLQTKLEDSDRESVAYTIDNLTKRLETIRYQSTESTFVDSFRRQIDSFREGNYANCTYIPPGNEDNLFEVVRNRRLHNNLKP